MKRNVSILALLAAAVAAYAQDGVIPEKNGGWNPAITTVNGEYTMTQKTPKLLSAAAFKVDPKATYQLSGKFRTDGSDPQKKLLFFGAEAYTAANQLIGSPQVNIYPGTETELTKDLKRGDKIAYVKDASKWNRKNGAAVIAFRIQDNLADLPNNRYSPNIAKIEEKDGEWAVHLKMPIWNGFPAGTRVRQHAHSMGRNFFVANYGQMKSKEWTEFKASISGISPHGATLRQWWRGTATAKICIQASPGVQFKDIVLRRIEPQKRK